MVVQGGGQGAARRSLLAFFLFAALACAAAPLALKDDYRSPRNKERPLRKATRLIVLHTTEAHAKSALNKLSERGEAHYCVTETGEAYRIIDRDREAFHAGRSMWNARENCDEYAIGIEVVGYHDQTMPLRQLLALKELVARLKRSYGLSDAQVVCHSHVAYGAPNTWHPRRHRGRKRCGMLFAMPSVRAKLGLRARPAYDPDVRAKRLVQADAYLGSVLYGGVDTMAAFYGRGQTQIAAAPSPKGAAKKAAGAGAAKKAAPAKPAAAPAAASREAEEASTDWLRVAGLKGGYFKKKARLVAGPPPSAAPATNGVRALPLPPGLRIRRTGDDVRDLAALAKLPGYTRGGPVSAKNSPFKIAGTAWNAASTYYYGPRGGITTGDKVDEKAVEPGTFIFFKKK